MAKPYSMDLRERAVAAVIEGGMSRQAAAKRFGIAASSAINGFSVAERRAARRRVRWAVTSPTFYPGSIATGCWNVLPGISRYAVWWPSWPSAG